MESNTQELTREQLDAEAKRVAITIFEQLGGVRFLIMVGGEVEYISRNPTTGNTTLFISFKMFDKADKLAITYDYGSDTYLFFLIKSGKKPTIYYSQSDVYCDQLIPLFEEKTGLVASGIDIVFV